MYKVCAHKSDRVTGEHLSGLTGDFSANLLLYVVC